MRLTTSYFIKFSFVLEIIVFSVKLAALLLVSGAVLFSETLHSLTDLVNSSFVYIGLRLSRKPPDQSHPFGYGKEKFFWALLTAFFMLTVSSTLSVVKGVNQLIDPEPLRHLTFGIWSMAIGTILSLITLFMGLRIIFGEKPMTLESMSLFSDPSVKVKVAEDMAAVTGNLLALGAIYMYYSTKRTFYDGAAAIAVGVMIAVLGFSVAKESKDLIIGRSAKRKQRKLIAGAALSVAEVRRVMDLKTMLMGPDEILVNIEINLVGGLETSEVERVMDEVRSRITKAIPQAVHVQVEVESMENGGGRYDKY